MGARHIKLVLIIESMHIIHWYVDTSYGTPSNCKGHTGVMMTMGFGALMIISRGQKSKVKISTKAELVGLDDDLEGILWGKYFLE